MEVPRQVAFQEKFFKLIEFIYYNTLDTCISGGLWTTRPIASACSPWG